MADAAPNVDPKQYPKVMADKAREARIAAEQEATEQDAPEEVIKLAGQVRAQETARQTRGKIEKVAKKVAVEMPIAEPGVLSPEHAKAMKTAIGEWLERRQMPQNRINEELMRDSLNKNFAVTPDDNISDDLLAAISEIQISSTVSVSEINRAQNSVAVIEQQSTV